MGNEPIKMTNWSAGERAEDAYLAPEIRRLCLQGDVKDHPTLEAGRITTSGIVGVNGKFITTESGSVYELGDVQPAYLEWCKEQKSMHIPTAEEPIKLHKKPVAEGVGDSEN